MAVQIQSESFSLALYRPQVTSEQNMQLSPVTFQIHTANLNEYIDPVLDTLPAREIDYGHLFTYCFRRFGFPNVGSDSYKDIAQWWLTTPRVDLVLCIRPCVLPQPHFSLHFLVAAELASACRNWERQDVDAWVERKLDWAEAQGLPEWMPSFLNSYRQSEWPDATWRDAYRGYIAMFTPRKDRSPTFTVNETQEQTTQLNMLAEFAAKVAKFEELEPRPKFRVRRSKVSEWSSDDPMKPLALAAIEALRDLSTAVRVRDAAINGYGVLQYTPDEKIVMEPACAGLGVAAMINEAPDESVALYQLAHRLGAADIKTGIRRIIELGNAEGPI